MTSQGSASTCLDTGAIRLSRTFVPSDPLVLMLHGLGSNEHDLATLFPALPDRYVYASLRGIYPYEDGWAWFERDIDAERPERLEASVAAVLAWLDRPDIPRCLGLIGFSQGAVLALQLLRRFPHRFGWVAQLSGGPFPVDEPGDASLTYAQPAAFWGRGGQDPTVSAEAEDYVRQWMVTHTNMTEVRRPDLGHDVDDVIVRRLLDFVSAQPAPSAH
jgi:phospholipase/carboxylesterase